MHRWLACLTLWVIWVPGMAAAQSAPMERIEFDAAVARAIERNPTVAIASTSILRSEAILQQARAVNRPWVTGTVTNTTLDGERGFDGQVTSPQNQTLLAVQATMPVLAAAQWAARVQAEDQVAISRLSVTDVRRQVAVATAQAYLSLIALKRQIDVSLRALDTAQAQLDYNHARVQGGVGSRLNEVRSATEVATNRTRHEGLLFLVRRAQEALGVLLAADGPVDAGGEPAFDVPADVEEAEWMGLRPDLRLFAAEQLAADRTVRDSSKDWWPTGNFSFDPMYLTPGSVFQPSGSWRFLLTLSQPVLDGGQRAGVKRERIAARDAAALTVTQQQIQARSEVRLAREAVASFERALASARQAAVHANEALQITIVAFEAGASTNIEVIDAQRSARDVDTSVTVAEDAVRQARLDLLVALGRFPQ